MKTTRSTAARLTNAIGCAVFFAVNVLVVRGQPVPSVGPQTEQEAKKGEAQTSLEIRTFDQALVEKVIRLVSDPLQRSLRAAQERDLRAAQDAQQDIAVIRRVVDLMEAHLTTAKAWEIFKRMHSLSSLSDPRLDTLFESSGIAFADLVKSSQTALLRSPEASPVLDHFAELAKQNHDRINAAIFREAVSNADEQVKRLSADVSGVGLSPFRLRLFLEGQEAKTAVPMALVNEMLRAVDDRTRKQGQSAPPQPDKG